MHVVLSKCRSKCASGICTESSTYLMYTLPIAKIITRKYHLNADDFQLYISFKIGKGGVSKKLTPGWHQDKSGVLLFTSTFRDEPVLGYLDVVDDKIKHVSNAKTL